MKYQIAWRRKNTTYLHFGPRLFEDRKEAEEMAEGLTMEHPQYDHGVQTCDDEGNHFGDVWFPSEHPKPNMLETRLTGDVVKPEETRSPTGQFDPEDRKLLLSHPEAPASPSTPTDTDPERDD